VAGDAEGLTPPNLKANFPGCVVIDGDPFEMFGVLVFVLQAVSVRLGVKPRYDQLQAAEVSFLGVGRSASIWKYHSTLPGAPETARSGKISWPTMLNVALPP